MGSRDTGANDVELVTAIREFNRFYTARLGLLRTRYLDGEFSLTEARVLYEIAANPDLTASTLRSVLGLDPGYISRTLAHLTKQQLVRQSVSKADGREKLLTLTSQGYRELVALNEQSGLQIKRLLQPLRVSERQMVAASLSKVRLLLSGTRRTDMQVVALTEVTDDALRLLKEYYDALGVVQRDGAATVRKIIAGASGGMWVAYVGGDAVGCVMLRPLESRPFAGECKRLYVQPRARGHGVATALLDAQEAYARSQDLHWIYLDSRADLTAAIAVYRKRGYVPCERYNENPQATVFLRKRLGPLRRHRGNARTRKD